MQRQHLKLCHPIIVLASVWLACSNSQGIVAAEPRRAHILTLALDELERHMIQNEWTETLPPATSFGVERVIAFEDHAHFIYLSGATWKGESESVKTPEIGEAEILRRVIFIRPGIVVVDDQIAQGADEISWKVIGRGFRNSNEPDLVAAGQQAAYRIRSVLPATAKWRIDPAQQQRSALHTAPLPHDAEGKQSRLLHVLSFSKDQEAMLPQCSLKRDGYGLHLELTEPVGAEVATRIIRLWLPHSSTSGKLQIVQRDGSELLAERLLPAGILPPGLEAAQRRLQWNLPYRIKGLATWDTQRPSNELRRLVERGQITPCRMVEIGCGTGNDAIYLAGRGFDVTAIDIAPAALEIAERKANEAGVKVRWLLADVLQPPLLKSFDFVYDRGCYHELRRQHSEAYVAAVRELTRQGSKVLILAASANKDSHWRFDGPPRVREEDIRKDFAAGFRLLDLREFRFHPVPSDREGPLAWSILLQREKRSIEAR